MVPGSVMLIGGDPGIGKTTLLLQALPLLAETGEQVLYVSGEESPRQIKMRGNASASAASISSFSERHPSNKSSKPFKKSSRQRSSWIRFRRSIPSN